MTKKLLYLFFLLISLHLPVLAQTDSLNTETESEDKSNKAYSPTIGFGVGTFSFYGDIRDYNYRLPLSGNFGYTLYVNQKITDYLSLTFSALVGKIKVDERKHDRFLNFDTDIFSGGVAVEYNFDHFLPKDRNLTPFVSVGIEILEFNPKSDILAAGGQRYNVWSDGTIRSLPENAPNAESAQIVQRDYTYETELSEKSFKNRGFDKRAIGFPIAAGVTMRLNDQFDFRVGASYHFTNTDYIDGYSPKTSEKFFNMNNAKSDNDKFLFANFSIAYNFQKVPKGQYEYYDGGGKRPDEYIDYAAFDNSDFDMDGVIDFLDKCPNTPRNVEVDSTGCPVDTDKDGIPDYIDKEINSPNPNFVDQYGVSLTDEMVYQRFLKFNDSTGSNAEIVRKSFSAIGRPTQAERYKVSLGVFSKNESPEQIELMLQVPDLTIEEIGNKVYYTSGNFSHKNQAIERKKNLEEMGLQNPSILEKSQEGIYRQASVAATSSESSSESLDQVYFRIQLGAFKKKPTSDQYKHIPSLHVSESDGIYRYFSGYFTDYSSAAKHKVQMIIKGYADAFVVGYKDGKKVSLQSLGVETINPSPLNAE